MGGRWELHPGPDPAPRSTPPPGALGSALQAGLGPALCAPGCCAPAVALVLEQRGPQGHPTWGEAASSFSMRQIGPTRGTGHGPRGLPAAGRRLAGGAACSPTRRERRVFECGNGARCQNAPEPIGSQGQGAPPPGPGGEACALPLARLRLAALPSSSFLAGAARAGCPGGFPGFRRAPSGRSRSRTGPRPHGHRAGPAATAPCQSLVQIAHVWRSAVHQAGRWSGSMGRGQEAEVAGSKVQGSWPSGAGARERPQMLIPRLPRQGVLDSLWDQLPLLWPWLLEWPGTACSPGPGTAASW